MKHLKRTEIQTELWDDCIENSTYSLPYAFSWYLDIICPSWSALVIEKNGQYEACFPLPWRQKLGVKYVYPPFFIQQLGLFSRENMEAGEFVKTALTKYNWVELYVNPNTYHEGVVERCNLVLPLGNEQNEFYKNYSSNHKRNISKANKSELKVKESNDFQTTINLFQKNKGESLKHLKQEDYLKFSKLCNEAQVRKKLFVLEVVSSFQTVICSGIFLKHNKRIIFLFSGNSEEGKKTAALFFLLNHVVELYQNQGYVLDFEGSENEGLQRFYKGFGARNENYYFIQHKNLGFPLNLIKK